MGQQQLLLVILVTIIVGIATVVAINTFGSAADSANVDAVRLDLASIAASAQGYYMKPEMLGGGSRSFTGITFHNIAFAGTVTSNTEAENENGTYRLSDNGNEENVELTAFASSEYVNGEPAGEPTFTVTIIPNGLLWDGENE
jgi:Tfp pilus assembly protein PilE